MKIFNPQLKLIDKEYWLRYWTEERPYYDMMQKSDLTFEAREEAAKYYYENWQKSFQEVRIHPSQIEAFDNLALSQPDYDYGTIIWKDILKKGVQLPSDSNIEIQKCADKMDKDHFPTEWNFYAFLKERDSIPEEKFYCVDCGAEMNKGEAATFTCCDSCWDKAYPKMGDWSQFDLDKLANVLEDKYKVSSDGIAFATMKMVEFYKKNKNSSTPLEPIQVSKEDETAINFGEWLKFNAKYCEPDGWKDENGLGETKSTRDLFKQFSKENE